MTPRGHASRAHDVEFETPTYYLQATALSFRLDFPCDHPQPLRRSGDECTVGRSSAGSVRMPVFWTFCRRMSRCNDDRSVQAPRKYVLCMCTPGELAIVM